MMWLLLLVLLLANGPVQAQRTDLPSQELGAIIATHYGAGDCSSATLNAALSAIGSLQVTLLVPPVPRNSIVPCTWNLSTGVTVPANVTLYIPRGSILTPAPGVTLTMAGAIFAPSEVQIFNANESTTGMVRFSPGTIHQIPGTWFGMRCDDVVDNSLLLMAAINSTPTTLVTQVEGAKVIIPAGKCKFTTPLVPSKPVHLIGAGAGRASGGGHRQTSLNYTGTGTFLTLTTNTVSGSILEGFNIDHTPTGTPAEVAVDIGEGSTATLLRDLSILQPGTPFSIAAIRIGHLASSHSTSFHNVFVRTAAPIGLLCEAVQSGLYLLDSTIHHHSVRNVQLGPVSGDTCREVQIVNSRFESANAGGDGIVVYRAEYVNIIGSHFEVSLDAADNKASIRVPAEASQNHNLVIGRSRFRVGKATGVAISIENAAQILHVYDGTFTSGPSEDPIGFIFNGASRYMRLDSNYVGAGCDPDNFPATCPVLVGGVPLVLPTGGSTLANVDDNRTVKQSAPGKRTGYVPYILCQDYEPLGTTDGATTPLATCTIPANTLSVLDGVQAVTIRAWGSFDDDEDNKRIRLFFDNLTLIDSGVITSAGPSDDSWDIECEVARSGITGVQTRCRYIWDDETSATSTLSTVMTVTAANITTPFTADIVILLQANGTNSDDIFKRGFTVDVRKIAP